MASLIASSAAFIEQLTHSPDLESAIGNICTQHLQARALAVHGALEGDSCEALITAVKLLVQDALSLPEWVQNDFVCETCDTSWTFGPAVAEVIMSAVATVAGLADPDLLSSLGNVNENQRFDVLETLGEELDCLAQYLFGFLCRSEARFADLNALDERVQLALRNTCAWAIAAVGRTVGYHRLTGEVLWDWCSFDPLWAFLLTKGALTLQDWQIRPIAVEVPYDLQELQEAVAAAAMRLSHHNVAFMKDVSIGDADSDAVTIITRSMQMANHRAQVASALVETQLLAPLLRAVGNMHSRTSKAKLMTFLVGLLQPDLAEDPPWAHSAFSAPFILEYARSVVTVLRRVLQEHLMDIWTLMSEVPVMGRVPRGFLKECSDFACLVSDGEDQAAGCTLLIRAVIGEKTAAEIGILDPVYHATLCVLASNAKVRPSFDGADGGLSTMLQHMSEFQRPVAVSLLTTWKGVVRCSEIPAWIQIVAPLGNGVDPQITPSEIKVDTQVHTGIPVQCPDISGGLRELLQSAPDGLRCAIDGRLVTDPVCSPHGYVFERSVIVQRLALAPGQCPISGLPLRIEDCKRDAEIRKKAARWFRDQRCARKAQPKQSQSQVIASDANSDTNEEEFVTH